MPAKSKGARLWLKPARPERGERGVWVIRDGDRSRSTGCGPDDLGGAEQALKAYLAEKHDPARQRGSNPLVARLPDVVALYAREVAASKARPGEYARRLRAILSHFGDVPLSTITRSACIRYAQARGSQQAARRELEDLRAAINHWFGDSLVAAKINVELPAKASPRQTWHTRSEMARLLWAAWRRTAPIPSGGERHVARHIARFMLIGLYTGTRAAAICAAGFERGIGRGWIDLDAGVFYRRPEDQSETIKRRPPVRLHPRLLAHLRRWRRLGIAMHAPVEWQGRPVLRVSKGYAAVSKAAGVKSSPHVLRHTAATWAMQGGARTWDAAEFFGMSEKVLLKTYGHHHPDHQAGVLAAIGRR